MHEQWIINGKRQSRVTLFELPVELAKFHTARKIEIEDGRSFIRLFSIRSGHGSAKLDVNGALQFPEINPPEHKAEFTLEGQYTVDLWASGVLALSHQYDDYWKNVARFLGISESEVKDRILEPDHQDMLNYFYGAFSRILETRNSMPIGALDVRTNIYGHGHLTVMLSPDNGEYNTKLARKLLFGGLESELRVCEPDLKKAMAFYWLVQKWRSELNGVHCSIRVADGGAVTTADPECPISVVLSGFTKDEAAHAQAALNRCKSNSCVIRQSKSKHRRYMLEVSMDTALEVLQGFPIRQLVVADTLASMRQDISGSNVGHVHITQELAVKDNIKLVTGTGRDCKYYILRIEGEDSMRGMMTALVHYMRLNAQKMQLPDWLIGNMALNNDTLAVPVSVLPGRNMAQLGRLLDLVADAAAPVLANLKADNFAAFDRHQREMGKITNQIFSMTYETAEIDTALDGFIIRELYSPDEVPEALSRLESMRNSLELNEGCYRISLCPSAHSDLPRHDLFISSELYKRMDDKGLNSLFSLLPLIYVRETGGAPDASPPPPG